MILVTGATGCLGSHIARALVRRGSAVAILRRRGDSCEAIGDIRDRVEHRIADVRNARAVDAAMHGIRSVYHVAGIAVPLNRLSRLMYEVNVVGTENVARAALAHGVRRLVHTSSASAVGFPPTGVVADENFAFNGEEIGHAYMLTKWSGEQVVRSYVARGLDAVIVNPTAVLGAASDPLYSWGSLYLRVQRGHLPMYPPGGVGVITSRDMVDGHLRAMERGRTGERYILNSENIRYRELIGVMAEVAGTRPPRFRAPELLLRGAARAGELLSVFAGALIEQPLLVPENLAPMLREIYYDQGKAIRELGLSQTPVVEAIRAMREWHRVPHRSVHD